MNRGKVLESGEQKYVLNDFYILDIIIFKKKKTDKSCFCLTIDLEFKPRYSVDEEFFHL